MCIQDFLPDFIQNLCDVADALSGENKNTSYDKRAIEEFQKNVDKIACAYLSSVNLSQEKIRAFSKFVDALE